MPKAKVSLVHSCPEDVLSSTSVIFCFEYRTSPIRASEIAEALCLSVIYELGSYSPKHYKSMEMMLRSACYEESWSIATYLLAECSDMEQVNQFIMVLKLMDCGYKGAFHYNPAIIKEKWDPLIAMSRHLMAIDDHASAASVKAIAVRRKVPNLLDDNLCENIQEDLSSVGKILNRCHEALETSFRTAVNEARID